MKIIANLLVALVALLHMGFLVLEMFLWTTPFGLKTFNMTPEVAAKSKNADLLGFLRVFGPNGPMAWTQEWTLKCAPPGVRRDASSHWDRGAVLAALLGVGGLPRCYSSTIAGTAIGSPTAMEGIVRL